jgi:hypothetical protein
VDVVENETELRSRESGLLLSRPSLETGAQERDHEAFSIQSCTRVRSVTFGGKESRTLDRPPVMEHELRSSCFALVQIGAEAIAQRLPVEAQAKFAHRFDVVGVAPNPHLGRHKTNVIGPLTVRRRRAAQIRTGFASATDLR